MKHDTCIIVPAYNEGKVIYHTLKQLVDVYPLVVCVNDGSRDETELQAKRSKAIVINHPINLGQGAALQTGITYALQLPNVRYFVTFDADGQHDIHDISSMINCLKKDKLDVVLGSRFLGKTEGMPLSKRVTLKGAVLFTNMMSRIKLTDAHNGLRVFNRHFATSLSISMHGMAHASEIIDHISDGGWRYAEAPVTIRYTDYSKNKGQSLLNSINISVDLMLNKAKK